MHCTSPLLLRFRRCWVPLATPDPDQLTTQLPCSCSFSHRKVGSVTVPTSSGGPWRSRLIGETLCLRVWDQT